MSLINRLIRDARTKPDFLTIRPQDVGRIAEHIGFLTYDRSRLPSDEELREIILRGDVKLLGVPIKVWGAARLSHARTPPAAPAPADRHQAEPPRAQNTSPK